MKGKVIISIFLSLLVFKNFGQVYKYVYYMDANLNLTQKDISVVIAKGYDEDGLVKLDCFEKASNKMILSAGFKDSSLAILHGLFRTYYNDLKPELEGNYTNNVMTGVWKQWNSRGLITDSTIYNSGIRTAYAHYEYSFKNDIVYPPSDLKPEEYTLYYSFTDSINNGLVEKQYSVKKGIGKLSFEANFIGTRGLLKEYDSTGKVKTDSVFDRKLKEAQFEGGEYGWIRFLQQNLDAVTPTNNNAPPGKYTVIVKFIVNPDGSLDDISAETNPGYGTAQEAIRVIQKSSKWQPAVMYGRYVRAHRRQPITFVVE